VAIPHVVVLAAALLALLCLPCALAVVRRADQLAFRRSWARRDVGEIRLLHRLDHGLSRLVAQLPATPPADAPLPGIEQIAAELRRLDGQRRNGPTTESTLWLAAVLRAYDEWLRLACRSLGVPEHLEPLDGIDRDIERVRVESELQANGMTFR
jgi:hypothetical protein